jgi:hypothetical protein
MCKAEQHPWAQRADGWRSRAMPKGPEADASGELGGGYAETAGESMIASTVGMASKAQAGLPYQALIAAAAACALFSLP